MAAEQPKWECNVGRRRERRVSAGEAARKRWGSVGEQTKRDDKKVAKKKASRLN
jgi:hypothetical protein